MLRWSSTTRILGIRGAAGPRSTHRGTSEQDTSESPNVQCQLPRGARGSSSSELGARKLFYGSRRLGTTRICKHFHHASTGIRGEVGEHVVDRLHFGRNARTFG